MEVFRIVGFTFVSCSLFWFGWALIKAPHMLDEPRSGSGSFIRWHYIRACAVLISATALPYGFTLWALDGIFQPLLEVLAGGFGFAGLALTNHLWKNRWAATSRLHLARLHHAMLERLAHRRPISPDELARLQTQYNSVELDSDREFLQSHIADLIALREWAQGCNGDLT